MRLRAAAAVVLAAGLAFAMPATVVRADDDKAPVAAKPATSTAPLSAESKAKALELIKNAETYLRARQDKTTGGWSTPKPDADGKTPPALPAITALILMGLAADPAHKADDDAIMLGTKYLLNHQQDDGGIYDRMLPSYNTALSVSALSTIGTPDAKRAAARGVEFLKKLQYSEASEPIVGGTEAPQKVTKDHAFYGGVGYGKHGRPDNSNLAMFMQAMEDAGVSPEDPAVQRALVFLKRTQMDDRINDMNYAKGSRQGGFVYATVPNAESVEGRAGQSHAGTMEETLSDGTKASRLRAYGSMTYAGFKSYLYAKLPKDDIRVKAAHDWIRRNYTLDENPGMGSSGLYYYYVVFARGLKATGDITIATLSENNEPTGQTKNWREDLIAKLATLQEKDGSFKSVDKRWMENDPELITAYALIALRQAVN